MKIRAILKLNVSKLCKANSKRRKKTKQKPFTNVSRMKNAQKVSLIIQTTQFQTIHFLMTKTRQVKFNPRSVQKTSVQYFSVKSSSLVNKGLLKDPQQCFRVNPTRSFTENDVCYLLNSS